MGFLPGTGMRMVTPAVASLSMMTTTPMACTGPATTTPSRTPMLPSIGAPRAHLGGWSGTHVLMTRVIGFLPPRSLTTGRIHARLLRARNSVSVWLRTTSLRRAWDIPGIPRCSTTRTRIRQTSWTSWRSSQRPPTQSSLAIAISSGLISIRKQEARSTTTLTRPMSLVWSGWTIGTTSRRSGVEPEVARMSYGSVIAWTRTQTPLTSSIRLWRCRSSGRDRRKAPHGRQSRNLSDYGGLCGLGWGLSEFKAVRIYD